MGNCKSQFFGLLSSSFNGTFVVAIMIVVSEQINKCFPTTCAYARQVKWIVISRVAQHYSPSLYLPNLMEICERLFEVTAKTSRLRFFFLDRADI